MGRGEGIAAHAPLDLLLSRLDIELARALDDQVQLLLPICRLPVVANINTCPSQSHRPHSTTAGQLTSETAMQPKTKRFLGYQPVCQIFLFAILTRRTKAGQRLSGLKTMAHHRAKPEYHLDSPHDVLQHDDTRISESESSVVSRTVMNKSGRLSPSRCNTMKRHESDDRTLQVSPSMF